MQKKQLLLLLLLANLAAIIVNMVSDTVEIFCEKYFGPHYLNILTILFVLILVAYVYLDNSVKKEPAKELDNNPSNNKTSQTPSSRPLSESINSEEGIFSSSYYAIEKAAANNKFRAAIDLIINEKSLRRAGYNLKGRFKKDFEDQIAGTVDYEENRKRENQLRSEILKLIEPYLPTEKYEDNSKQTEAFNTNAFQIKNADDRRLDTNHLILGRDDKLGEMIEKLKDSRKHAWQIIGEGGIGKTDFCKELLKRYLTAVPDRKVFWINVEFLPDINSLIEAIGKALGLGGGGKLPHILQAAADSQGLFYLDNLETLAEEEELPELLKNLKSTNDTDWIASTREVIGNWEKEPVKELDIDNAVQVFINQWDRAGGEPLDPKNEALRNFIDKDMGCHPLSMVITASRAGDVLGLEELIESWRSGSDALTKRLGTKERSRLDNLEYSMELSLNALEKYPNAIRLWALCSFFPDGMDKDALDYFSKNGIASANDRAILIRKSILRNENRRLSMLPPFSRFILKKIEKENSLFSEPVLFEDGYGFIEEHKPKDYLDTPPIWLKRLPFIFQFLLYFSKKVDNYPNQLSIADILNNFFNHQVFLGKTVLEQFLKFTNFEKVGKKYKSDFLNNLGELEFILGENDLARGHWTSAIKLYEKTGDDIGKANCKKNLGQLEFILGENDLARGHWASALKLYEKTGDDLGKANCKRNLGQLEFRLGENDLARGHWASALKLYEKTGSDLGKANCKSNLGQLEFRLGENDLARGHWASALKLYEKTGDDQGKANCKRNLGQLEFRLGENDLARGHWASAIKLYEKTGDDQGKAACFGYLGEIEMELNKFEKGIELLTKSMELTEKKGSLNDLIICNTDLAKAYYKSGKIESAKAHLDKAVELSVKYNVPRVTNRVEKIKKELLGEK